MTIVKLKTQRYEIDWTYEYEIDIDVDKYSFFTVEYRLASWHLIGHKCRRCKNEYEWTEKELSYDYVLFKDIVDFIANANTVKDKNGLRMCRVTEFNNLHRADIFYTELTKLLQAVDKKYNELLAREAIEVLRRKKGETK